MDITDFIEKAIKVDANWRYFDFYAAIDILSKTYLVDHEINEEKIAIIQNEDNTLGYLYLKYPFFFIKSEHHSLINSLLSEYSYIQYIKVDSIYHEYLSMDKLLYDKYFDHMENINNFSAQDFYFCNIT